MLRIQTGSNPYTPGHEPFDLLAFRAEKLIVEARDRLSGLAGNPDPVDHLQCAQQIMAQIALLRSAARQAGGKSPVALSDLQLDAERTAGAALRSLGLWGGDRRSKVHGGRLNLSVLGVTQNQSKRWQKVASIPPATYRHYIDSAVQTGREITRNGLLRFAFPSADDNHHNRGSAGTCPGESHLRVSREAASAAQRLRALSRELEDIAAQQQRNLATLHSALKETHSTTSPGPRARAAHPARRQSVLELRQLVERVEQIGRQAAAELQRLTLIQ